jgi:hypothetical protein
MTQSQRTSNTSQRRRALRKKTVVIMGMHTNLCIMSVTMYLELANISVGFVDGLIDSGFYYPSQRETLRSHSAMNARCTSWMAQEHGFVVDAYPLITALNALRPFRAEPKWALNAEKAHYFSRLYAK